MSLRLRKQIAVEQEQIGRLLEEHRPLLRKCAAKTRDPIERSALAAMLHSFYTGIENVFKRVAVECDGQSPGGDTWHRDLLDAMAEPSEQRPAVISEDLHDALRAYLNFRHVFRHGYGFRLEWARMSPLVDRCERCLRDFQEDVDLFLEEASQGKGG